MNIDPAARDQVLRVRLLTDFLFFTRWFHKAVYGQQFQVLPHLVQVADALTKVARGEITRLIINIPPRYGKTLMVIKTFISWCLATNPWAKFIHVSYSDDLAYDNSSAVREIIKHDEFQRLFPMALKSDSDAKKKWYTAAGGGLYAVSSGGAITGFGAGDMARVRSGTGFPADGFGGAFLIDDPIKPEDAHSETLRSRINRRINSTFMSRLNSPKTPVVLIMQRVHEDDMTGFLLNGGNGEEWEHLCIPVLDEDDRPIWPEKHSREKLAEMEAADPYVFAGQYMQRPAPLGGGIFKDDWWQYWTAQPPRLQWRAIYADTAQKTKEQNDWSVFQCWGRSWNGEAVLLDQDRGKWEAPELLVKARAFWNKHKQAPRELGSLRAFKVEDKVSGTSLIQSLRREGIPMVEIPRDKDKYTRALDAAPFIQSGNTRLPQDASWLSGYLAEFSAFPNGKHDDQIDPTMDAIMDIQASGVVDYSKLL